MILYYHSYRLLSWTVLLSILSQQWQTRKQKSVQEYLQQMQCQTSPAVKNILCCITIFLCPVNIISPSHRPGFTWFLDAACLKQITVLGFSAIFVCRLKCIYGFSFSLEEGSFSRFNNWISISYCCALRYPSLFLNCHLFWAGAFGIQTGNLHPYCTDSSSSVDTVCKVVFLSKRLAIFHLELVFG